MLCDEVKKHAFHTFEYGLIASVFMDHYICLCVRMAFQVSSVVVGLSQFCLWLSTWLSSYLYIPYVKARGCNHLWQFTF